MNRIRIRRPRADRAFRKGARNMITWADRHLWLAGRTVIRAVMMAHHEQVARGAAL
jgi:hypothetical protein